MKAMTKTKQKKNQIKLFNKYLDSKFVFMYFVLLLDINCLES